jgi:hypothetical protein
MHVRQLTGVVILALTVIGCARATDSSSSPRRQPDPLPTIAPGPVATPFAEDDPDVFALEWPPDRRTVAALQFRTMYGLRSDVPWIDAVTARDDAQAAVMEYGVPLTPEEVADLRTRHWDPELHRSVRDYGSRFAEFAGAWIDLRATGVVIAFTDHLDRHRSALRDLVAADADLEIRHVEWTADELEGFAIRVEGDLAWAAAHGMRLDADVDQIHNRVEVEFQGNPEDAELIAARYDHVPWLDIDWSGPPPWSGPTGDLRIVAVDQAARPRAGMWCDYIPMDPMVAYGESDAFTDRRGVCVLRRLPAVAHLIRLYPPPDETGANALLQQDPAGQVEVTVEPKGTTIEVVVPRP